MIKKSIKRALAAAGIEVRRARSYEPTEIDPVEFTRADLDVLHFVLDNRLTMGRRERLIATINACKHAVQAGIDGDFVECGVWRGGNSIAAQLTFENYGSDKKVWLFDTFTGMTEPSEVDTSRFVKKSSLERFRETQKDQHNEWCFASIEDVRSNFEQAGADLSRVQFVAGDVTKTSILACRPAAAC